MGKTDMALNNWDVKTSDILYKRFGAGESLVSDLESLAKEKGIKEAIIHLVSAV